MDILDGDNVIIDDPQFRNPFINDFYLTPNSVCINSGDPYYVKDCVDKAQRSNVFSTAARFEFFQISLMLEKELKRIDAKSIPFK